MNNAKDIANLTASMFEQFSVLFRAETKLEGALLEAALEMVNAKTLSRKHFDRLTAVMEALTVDRRELIEAVLAFSVGVSEAAGGPADWPKLH